MGEPDYYALLGVAETATPDELRSAYRRAARQCHPDVNPDDATAAARFVAIQRAYEVLSDPARRAVYRRAAPTVAPEPAPRPAADAPSPPTLPRDLQETLIAVRVIARMARPRVERRFRQLIRYLEGL